MVGLMDSILGACIYFQHGFFGGFVVARISSSCGS